MARGAVRNAAGLFAVLLWVGCTRPNLASILMPGDGMIAAPSDLGTAQTSAPDGMIAIQTDMASSAADGMIAPQADLATQPIITPPSPWTKVTSPTTAALSGIWGDTNGTRYIVGTSGTVLSAARGAAFQSVSS